MGRFVLLCIGQKIAQVLTFNVPAHIEFYFYLSIFGKSISSILVPH